VVAEASVGHLHFAVPGSSWAFACDRLPLARLDPGALGPFPGGAGTVECGHSS
jgi:hypothetical protein